MRALLRWPFPCCNPELLPWTGGAVSPGEGRGTPGRRQEPEGTRRWPRQEGWEVWGARHGAILPPRGSTLGQSARSHGGGSTGGSRENELLVGRAGSPQRSFPITSSAARGGLGAAAPAARRELLAEICLSHGWQRVLANGWERRAPSRPCLLPASAREGEPSTVSPRTSARGGAIGAL